MPSSRFPVTFELSTGRGSQTVRVKCDVPTNSRSDEICGEESVADWAACR